MTLFCLLITASRVVPFSYITWCITVFKHYILLYILILIQPFELEMHPIVRYRMLLMHAAASTVSRSKCTFYQFTLKTVLGVKHHIWSCKSYSRAMLKEGQLSLFSLLALNESCSLITSHRLNGFNFLCINHNSKIALTHKPPLEGYFQPFSLLGADICYLY